MTGQRLSSGALQIVPVGGRIGAEASGIRLDGDLPAEAIGAVRQALTKHKVLVFTDQHHLDDDEQVRLMSLFGTVVEHATVRGGYASKIDGDNLVQRANAWHSDSTFLAEYSAFSALRPVIVPASGGDTIWANTASAYQDLPASLRNLSDELRGVHTNIMDRTRFRRPLNAAEEEMAGAYDATVFETEHPVVRVIPETGECAMVLGVFLQHFVGVPLADSRQIFNVLQGFVTKPEHTFRRHWRLGDVALYDNRIVQHYAVNDYDDQKRLMCTVRTNGDLPVGKDGRCSTMRILSGKGQRMAAE